MNKLITSLHSFWIMIISILMIASTPLIVTATDYYVDSVAGNDALAGTSPATAWKTLTMISGIYLMPGDSVNLKKGSVWNNTQRLDLYGSGNYLTGEWVMYELMEQVGINPKSTTRLYTRISI